MYWLIPIADERVDVQVKLWNTLWTKYLSASAVVIHYEEAIYQVYAPTCTLVPYVCMHMFHGDQSIVHREP